MSSLLTPQQVQTISQAKILVFPTDTLPGLFARVHDAAAMKQIFFMKQRDPIKSLMFLLSDVDQIYQYCNPTPQQCQLIAKYSPGQVSFLLPIKTGTELSHYLYQEYQGEQYLGFRIPASNVAQEILSYTGPLAQTSLNISGEEPVLHSENIPASLLPSIDFLYPFQQSSNSASTMIRFVGNEIEVVRQGNIYIK